MIHDFAILKEAIGLEFVGVNPEFLKDGISHNFKLAMDAQPSLVTQSSAGIPAFLTTIVDPKVIDVVIAPNRASEIVGEEVQKGDWTTSTAMFIVAETTGETSSYGDWNTNGATGVNVNYPQRQPYLYQTIVQYGERELDMAGMGKIDLASRLNISAQVVLNKYQNKTYFYGVAGLQNYGLLNDPDLYAPITDTTWTPKDGAAIYTSILALFTQLQTQAGNIGIVDADSPMTLAMSPKMAINLLKTNQYNVNVTDQLKKNFPNLTVKTAVEYSTDAGELVQLLVNTLDGQQTAITAFNTKLRAHPVVVGLSNYMQKRSQGSYGTIIFRPYLIAQLLVSN